MKTLLVSFFNSSNLGDLLISSSLEDKVKGYSEVISFDYHGNEIIEDMRMDKPIGSSYQKNSLKTKMKRFNGATGLNQLVMRLKKNREIYSYPDFDMQIANVDALVIGGGNMIFDLESDTLAAKRFDYYVSKAKERNLPVFAMSIGIGPFHNKFQQKYTAEILAKCDFITFRDHQALALFKEYQPNKKYVGVVPDPVFFMEDKITEQQKNKIGLNIINPEVYLNELEPEQVKQGYVQLVSKLLETLEEDIIIYNTEAKDYPFCKKVYEPFRENKRVHLQKIDRLYDLYTLYNQLNLVIGTRMHSMITAFSQGIPIIGISYQQKVDAMFELLSDSESVFNLINISDSLDKIVKKAKIKVTDESEYHLKTREILKDKEKINSMFLNKIFSCR